MSERTNAEHSADKNRYVKVLREKVFLQDNLPFYMDFKKKRCNAHKLYKWQLEFF